MFTGVPYSIAANGILSRDHRDPIPWKALTLCRTTKTVVEALAKLMLLRKWLLKLVKLVEIWHFFLIKHAFEKKTHLKKSHSSQKAQ